jgi:hypothetical protein
LVRKDATASGRLQIKAYDGDDFRHSSAVAQQRLVVGVLKSGQAQQTGVIPQFSQQLGFAHRLSCIAANAGDPDQGFREGTVGPIHLLRGQLQDGIKKSDARISDAKFCRMNPHGQATRASRNIVATEGSLTAFIQAPFRGERKRMSGNDRASRQ